ncbi:YncE family protein [Novosphingobium terrae]|uniref:YncE family protein n=1 Tax=Novosphingobium terrae TaxID=2726189 RepID=UPI00197E8762|nr:YncE family protein [Novosphingobium terrae]
MLPPFRSLLASTSALLSVLAAPAAMAASAAAAFTQMPAIQVPDDLWDFAQWDGEHHRLLVAHGKDVLVVDPATRAVRSIGQIQYAHAVLPLPGHDRILVTSKFDDSVRILDGSSGAEVNRIAVAKDPDATVLSADGHKAYVMAAKAGTISVVDLDSMVETGRIPLKTGLEVAVLASPTLLAVNTEDFNEIELVDLATNKPAGTIPLPGCEGPTGLAIGPNGLALSACANGKAALVDIAHRKVVRMLPIGMGPDTVIWDAAHHRFLVPCGESGSLSIIAMDKAGPHVLPAVATGPNARTAALDPATGRLYLPSARLNPVIKGQPKTVVSGNFRILALSPR